MPFPKIEIYLNDNGGLSVANVKEGPRGPLVIDIDKAELGFTQDEAARKLGGVILDTLRLWHPSKMAELLPVDDTTSA